MPGGHQRIKKQSKPIRKSTRFQDISADTSKRTKANKLLVTINFTAAHTTHIKIKQTSAKIPEVNHDRIDKQNVQKDATFISFGKVLSTQGENMDSSSRALNSEYNCLAPVN